MGAEVSVLVHDRSEGRLGSLIPVLLDADAPVPVFLRPLDKRRVEDCEAVRDAVLGVSAKPPLEPGLVQGVVPTGQR